MKDLFVPFREQKMKMQVGKKYVIHAHLDDESYRIVASAKVDRYLSREKAPYEPGQEVSILIWQKTDLGFKAIIENRYSGLLYESEIFQPLHTGMTLKAYVKQVREDGKIDLILQKPGQGKVEDFAATLLVSRADTSLCMTRALPKRFTIHSVSARKPLKKQLAIYTKNIWYRCRKMGLNWQKNSNPYLQ